MNYDKLRPGQRAAIKTILERLAARETKSAIVLPTRYGKSDVIRISSLQAVHDGLSCGSIALSPNLLLRNQMVRPDKVKQMIVRHGLDGSVIARLRTMTDAFDYQPFSNGEFLLSSTIQLATRQVDMMAQLVETYSHKMSKPMLIHIDECHETSELKKRGELVQRVISSGACVVLYTATAIRADGEMIPGFRVEELSSEDDRRYQVTDAGDGKHNRIDVYETQRRVVRLLADHETTFQEAWEERPSPLCKLSREVIDVKLNDISADEEDIWLSDCSVSKARQYLSKCVRNPTVIDHAVDKFVSDLECLQKVNPQAAGMVYTGSDLSSVINGNPQPASYNQHAKEILAAIEARNPALQCSIVTMKTEEGDEKSTKQIEQFSGIDNRGGAGDILILKQMGGAGFDAPRVKVVLDLSPIRTPASIIQRLMRAATPWDGFRVASIITLADPLMEAIWGKYIVSEGGEAPTSNLSIDVGLEDSYLKLKPEDADRPLVAISDVKTTAFDDNEGTDGDLGNLEFVEEFVRRIPELLEEYTKAELSVRLAGFQYSSSTPSQPPPDPLDSRIEQLRRDIVSKVGYLAQKESPYNGPNGSNRKAHEESRKRWMTRAKVAAGVPAATELGNIKNVTTLDVMVNFLAR